MLVIILSLLAYFFLGIVLALLCLPIVIEDFKGNKKYCIITELFILFLWPVFIICQLFKFVKEDLIE